MFDNVGKTYVGISAVSTSLNVSLWLPEPIANGELSGAQQLAVAQDFCDFLNNRLEKGVADWQPQLTLRNL